MSIKQGIINTVDIMSYIVIGLVLISGFLITIGGHPLGGMLVAGIGWLICSLLYGFWFVLSSVAANTARQNDLIVKQNLLIEKLNRSFEAHLNNQFADE